MMVERFGLLREIHSQAIAVTLAAILTLYLWRIWRFTIQRRLRPDEPLEVPYWIPYQGHTIAFWRDLNSLIRSGRSFLIRNGRPSAEPFTLSLGPETVVIVTTGQDASIVFNNTRDLSWERFLRRLARSFHIKDRHADVLWHEPVAGEERYKDTLNPGNKTLLSWTENLWRQHLFPGQSFDSLSSELLLHVDQALTWERLQPCYKDSSHPVTLMDFCARFLIRKLTQSFLGDHVQQVAPNLTQDLFDFNEDDGKILVFEYPRFAARRAAHAQESVLNALRKYVQAPEELRQDASPLILAYLRETKRAGCNDDTTASLIFIILWAANLNVYRLIYWMLTYILHDPALLATIQKETAPAFDDHSNNSDDNIVIHKWIYENCPRLTAVFNESLRISSGSVLVRSVTAPLSIQGKLLHPGTTIMVPIRELHSNETIFGKNTSVFDATRFLGNDRDKTQYFRPFAGGVTYCTGRFLAKRLALVFVTMMIQRFEIEVVKRDGTAAETLEAPTIDQMSPTMGVMKPMKGQETYVRISERKSART